LLVKTPTQFPSAMARKKNTFSFPSFALEDPRFVKISGLALVMVGAYLFFAFLSYLFTWQADQSYATLPLSELLHDRNIIVDNALGKLGAKISHGFFFNFAGLASFVFSFALLCLGARLLSTKLEWNARVIISYSFFGLIFLSLLFSFVFSYFPFPFGGAMGNYLNNLLQANIGFFGTGILLIFFTLGIFVWIFNFNTENWVPTMGSFSNGTALKGTNKKTSSFSLRSLWPFGNGKKEKPALSTIRDTAGKAEPAQTKGGKNMSPKSKIENSADEEGPHYYEDENGYYDEEGYYYEYVTEEDTESQDQEDSDALAPLPSRPKQSSPKADTPISAKSVASQGTTIEVSKLDISDEPAPVITKPGINVSTKLASKAFDPHLELSSYVMPTLDLLAEYEQGDQQILDDEITLNKNRIKETLKNYSIEVTIPRATIGPTFTLFEIKPAAGIRISKIKTLEDDIAMSLSALGIRIIAPIPGKDTVGIEVPNEYKEIVSLRTILSSKKFNVEKEKMELPIALGTSISNGIHVADLTKMPHLLLAGATGMGKSVAINCILLSLLYSKHPAELKFVMVDPKKVELSIYEKLEKHFLAKLPDEEDPILIDTRRVIYTLNSLCIEMDNRYSLLKEAGVRSIKEYNNLFQSRRLSPEIGHQFLPYIVLVVDEFADLILTAGKEIELPLTRLAQLARAVGIHLIIATQRPTVNIITGTIKANFPVRIAFRVVSKVDSKTILDLAGADRLVGRGDMLFSHNGDIVRMQGPFVDTQEVNNVLNHIHSQQGYPQPFILPEFVDEKDIAKAEGKLDLGQIDEIFLQAARLIVQEQLGSTSLLQRKMKLGYNRAGRIMDQMEAFGIVGPSRGSKPRDVMVSDLLELERIFSDESILG